MRPNIDNYCLRSCLTSVKNDQMQLLQIQNAAFVLVITHAYTKGKNCLFVVFLIRLLYHEHAN